MLNDVSVSELEKAMPKKINGVVFYSIKEAAQILGVHANTVRYWIKNDRIMHRRVGASPQSPIYIPKSEIIRIASGEENHIE